jgi:AmmeMemoRadiSam system protein B
MNPSVRPAAVAGAFYPDSASALEGIVSLMLTEAPRDASPNPKAIIVPHAGYIYSGPIAACIYARLRRMRDIIRRIVLLGPTHRVAVNGLALPSCTDFSTPLGVVPIDHQGLATLVDLPQIVVNDAAHAQEHSLEVQLPFLQMVFGSFSLLPLAVGQASPDAIAEVLERLWGGEETLIVISSDLSHYLPYDSARKMDNETAQQIIDLDPSISHRQACGASPINGLLLAARKHGLQPVLVDLRNSGDTAGDKARVVGYGAFAFHEVGQHAH